MNFFIKMNLNKKSFFLRLKIFACFRFLMEQRSAIGLTIICDFFEDHNLLSKIVLKWLYYYCYYYFMFLTKIVRKEEF